MIPWMEGELSLGAILLVLRQQSKVKFDQFSALQSPTRRSFWNKKFRPIKRLFWDGGNIS